jgi:hypothetical protein
VSKRNDGGPAFPRPMGSTTGRFNSSQEGMTLRDYFAASAPGEIPAWFKHAPAQERPTIPVPHEALTEEQYKEWEGLGDWLNPEDASAEVRDFDAKYQVARETDAAWGVEQQVARYFAWRVFYAEQMIAALSSGASE